MTADSLNEPGQSDGPADSASRHDAWQLFEQELERWQSQGRQATFWWRDDDAVTSGPRLDRLLRLTAVTGLLLAVVPNPMQPELQPRVAGQQGLCVAQHGVAHINHAPRGQGLGAWELGLHREASVVLAELSQGFERLQQHFGEQFLPVLVPPWNHVADALLPELPALGFRGLSVFDARPAREPVPGLLCVNGHCDPLRWKPSAHFAGEEKKLRQLIRHLQQRRLGEVDAGEPTGFVTHHRDLDEPSWQFSERLAAVVASHPGATWLPPQQVFTA